VSLATTSTAPHPDPVSAALGRDTRPGAAVTLDAAVPRSRALTTRFVDFWLLGGASLLVWLVMFATQGFRAAWAIDQHFKNLTVTTASLSLLVNYPHFLISYKLAYTRGRRFVASHWWQLTAVPALLIATFAFAYAYYDTPVSQLPFMSMLSRDLNGLGRNALVVSGPRLGDVLFGLTFNVMIFTVGWHYTKQVFGCMMVYAYFDKYKFTPAQRTLTKYALLSIWWLNFVTGNVGGAQNNFSQFKYYSFDLPDVLVPITTFVVFAGLVLVLYEVFWKNYKTRGEAPGINMVVPFVALYVWWLPVTRQYEFYFLLTPFFHSLQYLAFVYKMEDTRLRGLNHPEIRGTILAFTIVVAGWLAFEFVPNEVDTALHTFNAWQMFFFFTAAMLFINIHHYFIDNVLWRFRDPEIQKYLLA
jgi:hypothetical protein